MEVKTGDEEAMVETTEVVEMEVAKAVEVEAMEVEATVDMTVAKEKAEAMEVPAHRSIDTFPIRVS